MRLRVWLLACLLIANLLSAVGSGTPVVAQVAPPPAEPVAVGTGGAVASVDPYATHAAIRTLRQGGNAIDAAVTAAAILGLVEPYSCGIGGGGFMVIYRADRARVVNVDSRELSPEAYHPEVFIDPATGAPIPFAERVTSGLGVGVPGTLRGWSEALDRYGTISLAKALAPAIRLAQRGFIVDETLEGQTASNLERFRAITPTAQLFLTPEGEPRPAGSTFKNPDLARAYREVARNGTNTFYDGPIAEAIVDVVTDPPVEPDAGLNVRPGLMTLDDMAEYEARIRRPTAVDYRGFDVYGMGPPSSGGSTVGESLNIMEGFDLAGLPREEALHNYLEASRLAFADRNAYLGDPEFVDVPLEGLLSDDFAADRRNNIGPEAAESPVPPGDPFPYQDDPSPSGSPPVTAAAGVGGSTTHLTVADAEGNVVSYTFTIESIGGSGITVPGYGFLLNNELTDFDPVPPHPNAPEARKRPRSSMSPTIVLQDGTPVLALGSPGGSTIITTVLQILMNSIDFGMSLPDAIVEPRLSQRNTTATNAEPAFLETPEAAALTGRGHSFTETAEIGAATGIAFLPDGSVQAAAEPVRRGGGSAAVTNPSGP
jgi:gamma-glutamyltranspeptidase / glutathione hydrolase